MPGTDRRSSTSSEDASIPPVRQVLQDGTELIPTRTAKTAAPKPAANPLQFIKVGPCDLYKAAQEQLKKVEEIKKVEKTVKEESEDWQSNLDNWKCSRRKRQEHIIDRVVEVKKLELEEHERNRRRGKTLSEMIEERTQKGIGPRKMSLLVYPDDDATDLSDLGISVSGKRNGSNDDSLQENKDQSGDLQGVENGTSNGKKNGTNGHETSSPEPEVYTYERAIQGYKSFAEKSVKRVSPPKPGSRIGEKLNELEQVRLRSNSVSDVQLPKVDIHKRRSLFEVVESADTRSPSAERVAKDLGGAQIVKARLSSLERRPDIPEKPTPRVADEVCLSLKDRLSSLEKQKTPELPGRRVSNEDVGNLSIKERLSSLEKGLKESINSNSCSDEEIGQKDLLSPAVSDREVSSPLVSSAAESHKLDGVAMEVGNTNSESEVTNNSLVEGVDSVKVDGMGQDIVIVETVVETANETTPINYVAINDNVPNVNSGANEVGEMLVEVERVEMQSLAVKEADCNTTSNKASVEESVVEVKFPNSGIDESHVEIVEDTEYAQNSQVEPITEMNEKTDLYEGSSNAIASPKCVDIQTTTKVEKTIVVSDAEGPIMVTQCSSTETVLEKDKSAESQKPMKLVVTKSRKVVKKPALRTRKLTPILTAPITVLSPVKSIGDLQIISEDIPMATHSDELLDIAEDELVAVTEDRAGAIAVPARPVPARRQTAKGVETSESGIDMEESSLYTDENIDEVLGEDDVDEDDEYLGQGDDGHVPDSARDLQMERRKLEQARGRDDSGFAEFERNRRNEETITRFNQDMNDSTGDAKTAVSVSQSISDSESETAEVLRQQEAVTRFDELIGISTDKKLREVHEDYKKIEPEVESKSCVSDFEELKMLDIENEQEKFVGASPLVELAPLTPVKQTNPVVSYENVIISNQMLELTHPDEVISFPLSPLCNVEPPKEKPPPPPPMDESDEEVEAPELPPKSSIRRLDSTKRIKKEIRKKRSDFLGIEGANDDAYLEPEVDVEPPPDMMTLLQEERRLDQQLYRQSLSSEADSTENVEVRPNAVDRLDKALFLDQGLYRQSICSESDSNHETAESRDSGVELDRGHVDDLCWNKELSEPHSRQNSEPYCNPSITSEEDEITKKEREIIEVLEKEEEWRYGKALSAPEDSVISESLAAKLRKLEQEKVQLEWARAEEEGRRMADEERLQAKETLLRQQETSPNINQSTDLSQDNLRAERERLEKEQIELARVRQELLVRQRPVERPQQGSMGTNLRYSMPDLQETRPPPPAARQSQTWTRVPSADNLLAPQQMSRTTLQALSAAPRSRIVNGETWMQPKRKADAPKSSYNYQHWLIQEAEHRRITEQQQRANQSRRSLPSQPPRSPAHYIPSQQSPQQRPHSGHFPINHGPPANYPPSQPILPGAQNGVHYASQSVPTHARAVSNPNHSQTSVPNHTHSHSLNRSMSPPSHHTVGLPPTPPVPHPHQHHNTNKPLPEAVIQTLTQRVQNKTSPRRRIEERPTPTKLPTPDSPHINGEQERMLSVSGKKKCSHCGEELGRGAAMVIESLRLFYHIDCFKCCVCHTQLGDGLMGTDVRVRNNKLHCHNCYSSDDGVKFSCV